MPTHKPGTDPTNTSSSAEDRLRRRIHRTFVPPHCEEPSVREIENKVLALIKLYADAGSTPNAINRAERELGQSLRAGQRLGVASEVGNGRKP